jgi:hypothetical protein
MIENLKQLFAHKEIATADEYRQVYATPHGKKVIDDICVRLCGVTKKEFSSTASKNDYAAGARGVGLTILEAVSKPIKE